MVERRTWSQARKLAVLFLIPGLPLLCLAVFSFFSALPVDKAALNAAVAPIEDRSARLPRAPGCGLNEIASAGGCRRVSVSAVRHEDVSFRSSIPLKGINPLRGTLTFPEPLDGPRPGVVLVGGSGPTDRDSNTPGDLITRFEVRFALFEQLAEALAKQGMVVLRYDKRACASCYKKLFDMDTFTVADFVTDARDAVAFLSERPEVSANAIVVMGHSQGGQLVPLIVKDEARVVGAVMLAGTSQTIGAVSAEQLRRLRALRVARGDYLSTWGLDAQIAKLEDCAARLEGPGYDPEESCIAPRVKQRVVRDYDALVATIPAALASLRCPVMALQGALDINVHPDQIAHYRQMLKGRDAEFHLVAGVSHPLTKGLDPTDLPRIDLEVLARLETFLGSIAQPAPL